MGCLSDVACTGDLDFFNLPFLAEKILGDKIKAYKDIAPKGRTFVELPFEEMKEHACAGADVALQLHGFLESALNERKLDQQSEERTLPLALTLHKVLKDGLHLDRKRLEQLRSRLEDSMLESKRCVADGIGSEIYLDSQDEISALMSEKGQPGMNGVDHDVPPQGSNIGESSHRLSTRFLWSTSRLTTSFMPCGPGPKGLSLSRRRKSARVEARCVEREDMRRYFDGFGSSSIEKRNMSQASRAVGCAVLSTGRAARIDGPCRRF
jgi:hypothetical protein